MRLGGHLAGGKAKRPNAVDPLLGIKCCHTVARVLIQIDVACRGCKFAAAGQNLGKSTLGHHKMAAARAFGVKGVDRPPANRGQRVVFLGAQEERRPGCIVGACGAYLRVRFDGERLTDRTLKVAGGVLPMTVLVNGASAGPAGGADVNGGAKPQRSTPVEFRKVRAEPWAKLATTLAFLDHPGGVLSMLAARDARFDGQFIAGVHSTGIYCRPSCRGQAVKGGVVIEAPVRGARA
mgnify:CR=1 FL=1